MQRNTTGRGRIGKRARKHHPKKEGRLPTVAASGRKTTDACDRLGERPGGRKCVAKRQKGIAFPAQISRGRAHASDNPSLDRRTGEDVDDISKWEVSQRPSVDDDKIIEVRPEEPPEEQPLPR